MFSAGPLTAPIMYLDRGGIAGLIGNQEGPRYLIYYLLHGGQFLYVGNVSASRTCYITGPGEGIR